MFIVWLAIRPLTNHTLTHKIIVFKMNFCHKSIDHNGTLSMRYTQHLFKFFFSSYVCLLGSSVQVKLKGMLHLFILRPFICYYRSMVSPVQWAPIGYWISEIDTKKCVAIKLNRYVRFFLLFSN